MEITINHWGSNSLLGSFITKIGYQNIDKTINIHLVNVYFDKLLAGIDIVDEIETFQDVFSHIGVRVYHISTLQ